MNSINKKRKIIIKHQSKSTYLRLNYLWKSAKSSCQENNWPNHRTNFKIQDSQFPLNFTLKPSRKLGIPYAFCQIWRKPGDVTSQLFCIQILDQRNSNNHSLKKKQKSRTVSSWIAKEKLACILNVDMLGHVTGDFSHTRKTIQKALQKSVQRSACRPIPGWIERGIKSRENVLGNSSWSSDLDGLN